VVLLQDLTLLQGQGHGRAVLGTLAAGETHSVQAATRLLGLEKEKRDQRGKTELFFLNSHRRDPEGQLYLGRLPQDLHVLAPLGVHVLAQLSKQLGHAGGAARARQAWGELRMRTWRYACLLQRKVL